jgi:Tol biopolymer transport system component
MCVAHPANAQLTTTRVSVDSAGIEGNSVSGVPAISANGRYVAFQSLASNLVPGDTNGLQDVFVHDRATSATTRVSVRSNGTQADQDCGLGRSCVTANGNVVFLSAASNLVPGDTNGIQDIFLHDFQSGVTTRVSLGSAGQQSNNSSVMPSITPDGRYLAFSSGATNFTPGVAWGPLRVFVRDLQTGVTTLTSVSAVGAAANGECWLPAISDDGRVVAFESNASNLVPGDTNGTWDIFAHDMVTGVTSRVSVTASGTEANQGSASPSFSFDGRFVAFMSAATNLIPNDTNGVQDAFVHDRLTGAIVRVSVNSGGVEANGWTIEPYLSADGRRVAFRSGASNLVPADTNGTIDVFLHDLLTGTTSRVSEATGGVQVSGFNGYIALSNSGRFIAYHSTAMDLVPGDYNGTVDVFVTDLGAAPIATYCTSGITSSGCVPVISGVGGPSASAGSGFTINVQSVEGAKQGLIFYGIDNTGFAPHTWGASSSWLCVKSPLQRTPPQNSGGSFGQCDGVLSIDFNAFLAAHPSTLGQPFSLGRAVFAQAWFRDPPSPKTTMLSDALAFFVEP